MATRIVTAEFHTVDDLPKVNWDVTFILTEVGLIPGRFYTKTKVTATTDSLGRISVGLWVNSESLNPTKYLVRDADNNVFGFNLVPGDPIPLTDLYLTQAISPTLETNLIQYLDDQLIGKLDASALNPILDARLSGLVGPSQVETMITDRLATYSTTSTIQTLLNQKQNDLYLTIPRSSVRLNQSNTQAIPGSFNVMRMNYNVKPTDVNNEYSLASRQFVPLTSGLFAISANTDAGTTAPRKLMGVRDAAIPGDPEIVRLGDATGTAGVMGSAVVPLLANNPYFISLQSDTGFTTFAGGSNLRIEQVMRF